MASTPSDALVLKASDITLEWILDRLPARLPATGFSLHPLTGGVLGEVVRLELELPTFEGTPSSPPSVVVKFLPEMSPYRDVSLGIKALARERLAYKHIQPLLPGHTSPRCLHSRIDDDGAGVLILEYHKPSRSVTLANGLTPPERECAIQSLAHLHRLSFDPTHTELITSLRAAIEPFHGPTYELLGSFFGGGHEAVLRELCPDASDPLREHFSAYSREDAIAALESSGGLSVSTLLHGDAWVTNWLPTLKPDHVILIDWQFLDFGCPFSDCAVALWFGGDDPEESTERSLMEAHRVTLVAGLAEPSDVDPSLGDPDAYWEHYATHGRAAALAWGVLSFETLLGRAEAPEAAEGARGKLLAKMRKLGEYVWLAKCRK